MIKRLFDFSAALVGITLSSPILAVVAMAIWLQDFRSPFYIAPRAARGGGTFRMVKFRSMTVDADRSGVNSTAVNDSRITRVGHLVRAYKVDEILQLWNVLVGNMSLVGPRPQVTADVRLYTGEEQRLLTVRPGITDPASIVFSDEGAILAGSDDADLLYNQVIRPWKSRLALLYIDHRSFASDIWLICLTILAIVSKSTALRLLLPVLDDWGANEMVRAMASRTQPLVAYPPPGTSTIVTTAR